MTAPLGQATCTSCGTAVLAARDSVTGETILLDPQRVTGGRVDVTRPPLGGLGFVAVDHITAPAPRQPAFELHTRTCPTPVPAATVDLDDDPVREQSGGWRR